MTPLTTLPYQSQCSMSMWQWNLYRWSTVRELKKQVAAQMGGGSADASNRRSKKTENRARVNKGK
jgi:hypothetical protein